LAYRVAVVGLRLNMLARWSASPDVATASSRIRSNLATAEQKLAAMRDLAARHMTVHLGMPDFRTSAGRLTESPDGG
jgi:hypothetical protein